MPCKGFGYWEDGYTEGYWQETEKTNEGFQSGQGNTVSDL